LKKSKLTIKGKKKIRPSSSVSPGYSTNNNSTMLKENKLAFNLSAVNIHENQKINAS
jgi:hypothetical protein